MGIKLLSFRRRAREKMRKITYFRVFLPRIGRLWIDLKWNERWVRSSDSNTMCQMIIFFFFVFSSDETRDKSVHWIHQRGRVVVVWETRRNSYSSPDTLIILFRSFSTMSRRWVMLTRSTVVLPSDRDNHHLVFRSNSTRSDGITVRVFSAWRWYQTSTDVLRLIRGTARWNQNNASGMNETHQSITFKARCLVFSPLRGTAQERQTFLEWHHLVLCAVGLKWKKKRNAFFPRLRLLLLLGYSKRTSC